MAACTVRESTGRLPELPVIGDRPANLPPASIVDGLATAIRRWGELTKAESARNAGEEAGTAETVDLREAHWTAYERFEDAFNILIARFEKEFPHGSDH